MQSDPKSDTMIINMQPLQNRPDWVRLYEATNELLSTLSEQSNC